ncbi:hypothetical protein [uncultured Nocardioides sp.]|uniref:hypothetical protein n=1 Tax=uncultured Nocardioides sp. TaxID=198441 RepID=UPI00260BF52C|nr:hypothetical protein [uncultured Nocardioides sp.]
MTSSRSTRDDVRVCLRPGVRVVRRDATHLQVGLDDLGLVVADRPATAAALAELATGRPVAPGQLDPRLLDDLTARGLLVDPTAMTALSPAGARARASVGAAFAAHGPAAAQRLTARRSLQVEVAGASDWAAQARELMTVAGLTVRAPDRRRRDSSGLLVLLGVGEPERARLDDAVRAGRPHLVLAAVQGRVRVGPFVVPGVTSCLRCLDAHLSERDPRRSLVVEQQGQGLEPVDPVLGTLAVAYAARDVVTWAEGGRPATWSATIEVSADAESGTTPRPVSPHPCCGCGWGNHLTG